MSIVSSFFGLVSTWFGFVGSCVVGPQATCVPFLGFVALAAVSLAAFVFLVRAYRAMGTDQTKVKAEREAQAREHAMRDRVRRKLQANTVRGSGGRRGWHVPA
jgi:hypothetical protein